MYVVLIGIVVVSVVQQVRHRLVARVLGGEGSYDSLGEEEQALVRADWVQRVKTRVEELLYAAGFEADGDSYSELGDDGNLVVRPTR